MDASTTLNKLLNTAGIPVAGVGPGTPMRIDFLPEATAEQIAQALIIRDEILPAELAAKEMEDTARNQVAAQGITIPGVETPLAATPTDWQYYTNLLAVCQCRKSEGKPDRACKITTLGGSHTFATNQAAIDGLLAYADQAQTLWEALIP